MAAKKLAVIGGGIVGLAAALKIGERKPDLSITLFEKEPQIGLHQSGHNSGVLHAGLHYQPGSLKANLAVQGIREMVRFCVAHKISHEICGNLIVATNAAELSRLEVLLRRGRQNGLQGVRILSRAEMLEIEPCAGGIAALHVPEEGIVDYGQVCQAIAEKLVARGDRIVTNARVTDLPMRSGTWLVCSTAGNFPADFIVNCGGLYCDRIAKLAKENPLFRIVPFRGEYYSLRESSRYLIRNLIYPVPDPVFPFLGVHFTRHINGAVEAGPNAVLAFSREGYRKTQINLRDLGEALLYPGLWRFIARHSKMCVDELKRSLSRAKFCEVLRKLVPGISEQDLACGSAGVRAQALSPAGELVQDFHLAVRRNAIHVLNAPSPAATASLAIGDFIAREVVKQLGE